MSNIKDGYSQGPLHIEQGGSYLHHKVVEDGDEEEKALVVSSSTPDTSLAETIYMLIMAATPSFTKAPNNALVTVEWVKNYLSAIESFDPLELTEEIKKLQEQLKNGLWIEGGKANSYR